MHPNPVYHDADLPQNIDFARERGFGVLVAQGAAAPMVSHVPFLIDEAGKTVDLHLVRSNPIARALDTPLQVTLAVSGGDSYVSPDWYGVADQVPTWNYIAVHLTGMIEQRPADELHRLLERQSAFYESRLLPKPPWTTGKMTAEVRDRMMRQIIPCRITIAGVDGTWKLGQNKPDHVREQAADQMAAYGFGTDVDVLSAMMRMAQSK